MKAYALCLMASASFSVVAAAIGYTIKDCSTPRYVSITTLER